VVSFPPVSPPRLYTPPSPRPYATQAQPISFFSILSPAQYLVRSTNHLAPRYAISSIPSLPRPSWVQILIALIYSVLTFAYPFPLSSLLCLVLRFGFVRPQWPSYLRPFTSLDHSQLRTWVFEFRWGKNLHPTSCVTSSSGAVWLGTEGGVSCPHTFHQEPSVPARPV